MSEPKPSPSPTKVKVIYHHLNDSERFVQILKPKFGVTTRKRQDMTVTRKKGVSNYTKKAEHDSYSKEEGE
ncbi:hypothetical protein AB990_07890 [Alkalihalobacillus pseudalcaliphilus]|nr:hypothetical protein AB990_07890 [Alkalihalobacillus pseudalcaliphilus]